MQLHWSTARVERALENVVGIAEAAEILGLSIRRVRELVADDRIPHKRIGHDYAFWKPQLVEYREVPRPRGRPPKGADS